MSFLHLNPEQIQQLLAALDARPEGLSRRELQAHIQGEGLSAQVFRRELTRLEAEGWIRTSGQTKAMRYHPGPHRPPALAPFRVSGSNREAPPAPSPAADYPPLGGEARILRDHLAQPQALRQPVGYQRSFLDKYRPNLTYYLPDALRSRLHTLGAPREPDFPAGTYARQVLQRLLVDLSWASSRMEGNTYSLLDTEKLIEFGKAAEGKDIAETQMILNHKAAIEYLVAAAEELKPDARTLLNLHAQLMENLLGNPMDEGRLRAGPVGIRGTVYQPLGVPQLVEECFRQILHLAAAIQDPFEQSFFMLVHLPYLQPFLDGNKRTARLAANIPFIHKNCVPITFMDVAPAAFTDGMIAVYELNRIELLRDVFVFAYERSCARFKAIRTSLGEPDPFRLAYRTPLKTIVREVVLGGAHGAAASARIKAFAEAELPEEVRDRFRAVAETELEGLHDGNFARYHLRPSEFEAWRTGRD